MKSKIFEKTVYKCPKKAKPNQTRPGLKRTFYSQPCANNVKTQPCLWVDSEEMTSNLFKKQSISGPGSEVDCGCCCFFFPGQFPHPSVDVVYADLDVTSTRLSCILNRAVSPPWWGGGGGGGWGRTVLTLLDIDLRTRHPSPGASCLSCWTELMSLSWFTTRYFIRSWSNNWANGSWTERCRCFAR